MAKRRSKTRKHSRRQAREITSKGRGVEIRDACRILDGIRGGMLRFVSRSPRLLKAVEGKPKLTRGVYEAIATVKNVDSDMRIARRLLSCPIPKKPEFRDTTLTGY